MRIKLVLFDALYTIVKPRAPIHVQYAQVFKPYLGTVDPMRVKTAFKIALKDVQRERPAYAVRKGVSIGPGAEGWWAEVIRRTAVGTGSDPTEFEGRLRAVRRYPFYTTNPRGARNKNGIGLKLRYSNARRAGRPGGSPLPRSSPAQ